MEIDDLPSWSGYNRWCTLLHNDSFFRDSYNKKVEKRKKKIDKHHDKIISKYYDWSFAPFPIHIDFYTFDLDRLKISIIGQVIPSVNELDNNNQTLDEMALSHLKCKKYSETYNLYKNIMESQSNFNNDMEEFLNTIRERIKKLVNSNVYNDRIELLLRYYLYKIVAASKQPEYIKNHLNHFEPYVIISLNPREELANPFYKEEEKNVQQDLEKNYDEVIASINTFKTNINNINKTISEFKDSLRRIIDDEDLKGMCSIEKRNLIGKIKSIFLH